MYIKAVCKPNQHSDAVNTALAKDNMDFNTATEKAKSFTKTPTNDEFLEFYGLYKQATVGDNTTAEPGTLDLKGKAKWAAWNKHKGLSQDAAKAAYIATYEKYAPKYA